MKGIIFHELEGNIYVNREVEIKGKIKAMLLYKIKDNTNEKCIKRNYSEMNTSKGNWKGKDENEE